jgi:hypothetical protein
LALKWKRYKRKGVSEMRPHVRDEDMSGVSVSDADNAEVAYGGVGMVARNPKNHEDQWYVAKKYFDENLEAV